MVNKALTNLTKVLSPGRICRGCGLVGRGLKQFVVKLELNFPAETLGALHKRVVGVVIRDGATEPATELTGMIGERCVSLRQPVEIFWNL
ncbi:hypothetical protein GN330_14700 [Nitratireductor sp. CAU 1489]|uniref:Uncharacterized protein n=1 Tax=Nitratireductor arenosus TaxID=2682096 RepID=A0A844QGS9_9HYPH|nr:hypothetical protein [Nitratireductor arenosus]MVA98495.1 hypothetical protein [Nitratireductor arenosus]